MSRRMAHLRKGIPVSMSEMTPAQGIRTLATRAYVLGIPT